MNNWWMCKRDDAPKYSTVAKWVAMFESGRNDNELKIHQYMKTVDST